MISPNAQAGLAYAAQLSGTPVAAYSDTVLEADGQHWFLVLSASKDAARLKALTANPALAKQVDDAVASVKA